MENIESKLYCALVSREWKEAGDILSGERELLKQLLSKKLDHLQRAIRNIAPTEIVMQLISPQNICMQDYYGNTALHEAVKKRRWDLVPVLLQHGADVNSTGCLDKTPLHWAAHHGAPADIITQLISPHNINMQATNGSTALHEAVKERRLELVPVLLQHGADPSLLDSPQPDQPLVLSLQALCIASIRRHMPVKSDASYEELGLPEILVSEVKLKPQAADIVKRARESVP